MIQFLSASKLYNNLPAVEDITFTIDKGEFVLLTGPSGSGKTTLIKMMIREIIPSKGKVIIDDQDITKLKRGHIPKIRRKIGVVFQDFKLLEEKNIFENISFALEIHGKSNREINEIVPYVLDIVGLEDKAYNFPKELSGGQQQKAAIARAIANDPQILIADEPTGNLDSDSTWEIIDILEKINKWGTTIIMATHGVEILSKLDYRKITVEDGKIVQDKKASKKSKTEEFEDQVVKAEEKTLKTKEKTSKKTKNEPNETSKQAKPKSNSDKENKIEPKKQTQEPKKQFKIKIGLSGKRKETQTEQIKEDETVPQKDSDHTDEFEKLSISTKKILDSNNYKNMQDILNAGIEKIRLIENIKGDQIQEIQKLIDFYLDS